MRLVALLVVLAGCDHVFGIGDPYEDARVSSNGSDAAIDTPTGSGRDATSVIDASLTSQAIVHFTFDGTMSDDQFRTVAACMGGGSCGTVTGGHVGFGSLGLSSGGCAKFVPNSYPPQFTLAMWVYPNSTAQQTLIARAFAATSTHAIWNLQGSSTSAMTFTTSNGAVDDAVVTTAKLGTNTWQHFVVTYDGTNLRIFLDTTEIGSLGLTLVSAGDVEAYLGCNAPGTSGFFTGNIDDVFIFDRALSSSEIGVIYGLGN